MMRSSLMEKHTGSISSLRHHMVSYWHLCPAMKKHMEFHFMSLITPSELTKWISDGTIKTGDILYQVIYHKTGPASLKHYTHIKLSFRKCLSIYGDLAFVLISPDETTRILTP